MSVHDDGFQPTCSCRALLRCLGRFCGCHRGVRGKALGVYVGPEVLEEDLYDCRTVNQVPKEIPMVLVVLHLRGEEDRVTPALRRDYESFLVVLAPM